MTDITGRALPQLTGDDAPCAHLCYCERAANRAEIERLKAALRWIADQIDNEDGDLDDIILCANKALAHEQSALTPVPPHDYFPSAMHMGDCAICGHVKEAGIHGRSVSAAPGSTVP